VNLATFDIINILQRELKQFNADGSVKADVPMSTVAGSGDSAGAVTKWP
jgi:hypothetical protein